MHNNAGAKSILDLFEPPTSVEITNEGNGNGSGCCGTSSLGSIPIPAISTATATATATISASASARSHNTNGHGDNNPHPQQSATKQTYANKIPPIPTTARSPNIRILILGPPTNLPSDFALYQQYNLELMCSGPQMARSLMEWVADCDARRIQEVEKAATNRIEEATEEDLSYGLGLGVNANVAKYRGVERGYTLGNVEGLELCKELKAILLKKESLEREGVNVKGEGNGNGSRSRSGSASVSVGKKSIARTSASGENHDVKTAIDAKYNGIDLLPRLGDLRRCMRSAIGTVEGWIKRKHGGSGSWRG